MRGEIGLPGQIGWTREADQAPNGWEECAGGSAWSCPRRKTRLFADLCCRDGWRTRYVCLKRPFWVTGDFPAPSRAQLTEPRQEMTRDEGSKGAFDDSRRRGDGGAGWIAHGRRRRRGREGPRKTGVEMGSERRASRTCGESLLSPDQLE